MGSPHQLAGQAQGGLGTLGFRSPTELHSSRGRSLGWVLHAGTGEADSPAGPTRMGHVLLWVSTSYPLVPPHLLSVASQSIRAGALGPEDSPPLYPGVEPGALTQAPLASLL